MCTMHTFSQELNNFNWEAGVLSNQQVKLFVILSENVVVNHKQNLIINKDT